MPLGPSEFLFPTGAESGATESGLLLAQSNEIAVLALICRPAQRQGRNSSNFYRGQASARVTPQSLCRCWPAAGCGQLCPRLLKAVTKQGSYTEQQFTESVLETWHSADTRDSKKETVTQEVPCPLAKDSKPGPVLLLS